jgi:hypothetical protein
MIAKLSFSPGATDTADTASVCCILSNPVELQTTSDSTAAEPEPASGRLVSMRKTTWLGPESNEIATFAPCGHRGERK